MQMTTDAAAALAFLRWLRPRGHWVLTAIDPDNKGIETRTFRGDEDETSLRDWLAAHGATRNIYFHVNPLTRDVDSKGSKADVAAVEFLHVDVDPRAREDIAAERTRILESLEKFEPAPSAVVFSGGGFQAFWRLEEPVEIGGDISAAANVELYNLALEVALGGDHCHDVSRIMRLPGTVNRPGAKKRRRGRVDEFARVEYLAGHAYPLSAFQQARPVQSEETGLPSKRRAKVSGNIRRLADVDELPEAVSDHIRRVIVNGHDPEDPQKYTHDGDTSGRSEALWAVICALVKAGCDDDLIFGIITDKDFAISGHVLDKGSRAEAYALRQIARGREHAISPKLLRLNERHAIIGDMGGRCRVVSEVWDQGTRRWRLSKQTFDDFRNRYLRDLVPVGEKMKPVGEWWLRHPAARYFDTIAFAPGEETPDNVLNLWRGFAVEPREGDCSLFLAHVRDNLCAGNETHYNYLMDWCARMMQHPAEQGHVAVVLRGEQGTGKGWFARVIGHLLGRHFLHISNSKHLVGHFNAHLRDCLLLFADEAFYAGDKHHASILKTLVTENTIFVEPKGVDPETAPNFIHLLMASNESWVVPAGPVERRFFVLDVGRDHMQDAAYFASIKAQLEAGGYEALLWHLLRRDISAFNPYLPPPKTRALQAQKILSMSDLEEWWYGKLCDGRVLPGHGEWRRDALCVELEADYVAYSRRFNRPARGNATRLGHFLRRAVPAVTRRQLGGKRQVVVDGRPEVVTRPWQYTLPPLDDCRKFWDDNFGGPFDWPDVTPPEDEEQL